MTGTPWGGDRACETPLCRIQYPKREGSHPPAGAQVTLSGTFTEDRITPRSGAQRHLKRAAVPVGSPAPANTLTSIVFDKRKEDHPAPAKHEHSTSVEIAGITYAARAPR